MNSIRTYGKPPFEMAVIHGGPGAPGEMAPVARELSGTWSVLEPFQMESTLEGQVQELRAVLEGNGDPPISLVGHSWGAMLAFICAAQNPSLVRKLILVGSAMFEEKYATQIMTTRLSRLTAEERSAAESLSQALNNPNTQDVGEVFAELGNLLSRADSFDPLPHESDVADYRYDIYQRVWREAEELRRSGGLLALGSQIQCPVTAIHGDYDPHPAEGVKAPLSSVLEDFRFISLEKCGHRPWIEKRAMGKFFAILRDELGRQHKKVAGKPQAPGR